MQNDSSKFENDDNQKTTPIDGGFLQSKHWAQFKREYGSVVFEFEQSGSRALVVEHKLPIAGKYWFIPRGPVTGSDENELRNLIRIIIRNSIEQEIGWLRIEPQSETDLKTIRQELGEMNEIVKSKKNHEPAQTLMVDLLAKEDEILAQMKSKTRYNIRLATRKGVKVEQARKKDDIEKFIELTKITARRDKITAHPNGYYRAMFEAIPQDILRIYSASYQDQVISSIMVSFFGGVATYLHGASADEKRNMMAPFALQWRAMQDAKKAGCRKYDLGGTKLVKKNEKWLPEEGGWQGITRFKQGFCPICEPVEFPGCWDIVINRSKYRAYRMMQSIKDIAGKFGK